jgi:hypothetical protein
MTWISVQFGILIDLIKALEALINSGFQEAMGPPGEPADIVKLAYVARRLAATYREMIQWVLRRRRLHVDEELQRVIALGQDCGLSAIRDIDNWAVALKKQRAEFVARGPADGEEVVFETKLTIRPVKEDEIRCELKRIEKIYIRR